MGMNREYLVKAIRDADIFKGFNSPRYPEVVRAFGLVDRRDFIPEGIYSFVTFVASDGWDEIARLCLVAHEKLHADAPDIAEAGSALSSLIESFGYWIRDCCIETRGMAYADLPLFIGDGQTCSQPSLVAFMADALELQEGLNVLEVGTGCGYHAAVTSHLVGKSGKLVSIEYIPGLARLAQGNLSLHFSRVLPLTALSELEAMADLPAGPLVLLQGDGSVGVPRLAPFDRIYLTCGIDSKSGFNPDVLARQLNACYGVLLYPEQNGALIKGVYSDGSCMLQEKFDGVGFVPLVGANS